MLTFAIGCVLKGGNAAILDDNRKESQRKAKVLIQKITLLARSAIAVAALAFSPRLRHKLGWHTDWIPLNHVTTISLSPDNPLIDGTIRIHSGLNSDIRLTNTTRKAYNDAYASLKTTLTMESCV